jgi:hypothetical protein
VIGFPSFEDECPEFENGRMPTHHVKPNSTTTASCHIHSSRLKSTEILKRNADSLPYLHTVADILKSSPLHPMRAECRALIILLRANAQ